MDAHANKDVVRRLVEDGLDGRDAAVVRACLAPGFVGHDPDEPSPRRVEDIEFLATRVLGEAFPDGSYVTLSMTAEEDRVVWQWAFLGSHTGRLGAAKPAGAKVELRGVTVFRLAGGQVVEDWTLRDGPGLAKRLGLAGLTSRATPARAPSR